MLSKFTRCLAACLLISFSTSLFSQKKFKIEATLLDSAAQKPLEFATVFLFLEKKDSAAATVKKPIRSSFSDEKGKFSFGELDEGGYSFEVSMVGYRNFFSEKLLLDKDLQLGEIRVAAGEQSLQQVTVVARKPLLEMKADRIIFNADADPTNDVGTGLDVLKKVPFLTVDGDDNIFLKGKSNFKVQLNGRNTGLMAKNPKEALRSFPAGLIKRVEVITSPGARYDAEGVGGIINIVTTGKVVGINGNVSSGINTLGQTNFNVGLSVKLGKLGGSAYFGGGDGGQNYRNNTYERTNFYPTNLYREFRESHGLGGNTWWWGNVELAYDLDSLKSLSFYVNPGGGGWRNTETTDHRGFDSELNLVEKATFTNAFENRWPNQTLGADYIQKFKKPEQELAIQLAISQRRDNSSSSSDRQFEFGFLQDFSSKIKEKTPEDENTLEINYVQPLRPNHSLSFGAKTILRKIDNSFSQEIMDSTGVFREVAGNSGIFHYRQNVFGGYTEYSFTHQKWSFKPGIRYEYTEVEGDLNGLNPFENDYPVVIPTFSTSYKISAARNLRLAYTKRIQRPGSWFLQPQVTNFDQRFISQGNPYLDPEFLHSIELGYSIFSGANNLNLTLEQAFTNNAINQFSRFDSTTGIISSNYFNLGKNRETGFAANGSATLFKKLTFYSNIMLSFVQIEGYSGTVFYKNSGITGNGYANFTYKMNKGWQVQGNCWLGIGSVTLQGRSGAWYNYQAGVSKSFLKNRSLRFALLCDMFAQKERVWRNSTTDPLFESKSEGFMPARAWRVSVSWRFGKLKENVSRKRGVSNSDTKSGGSSNN